MSSIPSAMRILGRRSLHAVRTGLLCLLFMGVAAGAARGGENDWFVPLGAPPKAAPRRISGGEAFPPLPLPATPLRRTERKRDPKPATLIGKVVWGETATFSDEAFGATEISDWNLTPADVQSLLQKANGALGVSYGSEPLSLAAFSGDPASPPVLFFSGGRSLRLGKEQLALLRQYVLGGGMIVADAAAGSPYFAASFREAMRAAFPELAWRTLPPDHPLFHMVYDVDKVVFPKNRKETQPVLEALYVGSRAAVVLSPFGLGVGWDGRDVPHVRDAVYYDPPSATKLGVNLVAYAIGYQRVAQNEAKAELYGAVDEKRPTDEFVFAQIRHDGAWNVHPGAASALLMRARKETALRVSLRRVPVELGRDDLSGVSFLYLSGLDDFRLTDLQVGALRDFLRGNGTLLINSGLGLQVFDRAVRRELARVLPGTQFQAIPVEHPLLRAFAPTQSVRYSPAVLKTEPGKERPALEGIVVNGDLRVIYSPIDLEAGWEGDEHPMARAYEPESAMRLGLNILIYANTH